MTISQLRRGARLWHVPGVPKPLCKRNYRAWVSSVQALGSKWLYAQPVQRVAP